MQAPDASVSIVLVGLQGAGKSTLATGFFGPTHVRVNLDTLKTRTKEARLLEECLAAGRPFVVDNTNLTVEERRRYTVAARARAVLVAVWVDTPVELALQRNAGRAGKARVPDHVIARALRRLEPPTCTEGFAAVWRVASRDSGWELAQTV